MVGRWRAGTTALAVTALALVAGGPTAQARATCATTVSIDVLSSRADLVTGGDALVAIRTTGADAHQLRVTLGDRDVTSAFAQRPDGRFEALLDGIRLGASHLTATLPSGTGATITLTDHPTGGPVFSGPAQQPYTCQATAVDALCDQAPAYSYLYLPVGRTQLAAYDPAHPPLDVSSTTTDEGRTVPFIVRQELGYADRDQYVIQVLFDPAKPWAAPWSPQPQWNHKLLIVHGGSCGSAYTVQDALLVGATGDGGVSNQNTTAAPTVTAAYVHGLGMGFAVLSTALDNAGVDCDIALQAESLLMGKERVTERYGPIAYTIGSGCSGGSLVPYQLANAFPGIYDGLTLTCPFPDFWSGTTIGWVQDLALLHAWFTGANAVGWTPEQIDAVLGQPYVDNAVAEVFYNVVIGFMDPTKACPGISSSQVYDPTTNPGGVRCSVTDWAPNVQGRRPASVWTTAEKAIGHGFVGLPLGNVGVVYGLEALQAGTITPAQLVALNTGIGSFDIDYKPTAQRTQADLETLARVYRSGEIDDARRLGDLPIIDGAPPGDPASENHPNHNSYVIRDRIRRWHGGSSPNFVLWEGAAPFFTDLEFYDNSLDAMDTWLAAITADHRALPSAAKVTADRPAALKDECWDGAGTVLNDGGCSFAQHYRTARNVAGAPFSNDVNACALKPLQRSDFSATFDDAQWASLERAFPGGVCDWSKPGLEQQATVPWQTYQAADGSAIVGGTPMPAVPVSSPIGQCAAPLATHPRRVAAPSRSLAATGASVRLPLAGVGLLAIGAAGHRRRRSASTEV